MGQTTRQTARPTIQPWSSSELNRIMMAARTMPGFIGEARARQFWPALLLLMLDLDISAAQAIQLPANVLDMKTGRMPFRHMIHQLHGMTFEAFTALPPGREKLLPWRSTRGETSAHSLESAYENVLSQAGLPIDELALFSRLQLTGRRCPAVLDAIQPALAFAPEQRHGMSPSSTNSAQQKSSLAAWSMPELNRIVVSARTMVDPVGEIAGADFWPALVLLILDLGISAEMAVQLPMSSLQLNHIQLLNTPALSALHPLTMEALQALPPDRDKLIPWPKDGGKPPFHMLYRDYKTVLFRAGYPFTQQNSFVRLQVTRRRLPNVMDLIEPVPGFEPHDGKPQLPRALARKRLLRALAKNDQLPLSDAPVKRPPKIETLGTKEFDSGRSTSTNARRSNAILHADAVALSDNPATLLNLFRSKFRSTRLRQSCSKQVGDYERALKLIYSYAGKELSFADLTDELVEEFLTYCLENGVSAATCNKYRSVLLSFWRWGWKKRLTNEQPRDVPKLKVEEAFVDAWTTAELELIVNAATKLPGHICDIPANVWWPAFILCLYDTGLRFNALILRQTAELNLDTGWLSVDAKDQKQRKAQAFKLHSDTLRFIRMMEPKDRKFLFPWYAVDGHAIRAQYRTILQAAGLPSTKRDLFHKLRRTSATSLAVVTDENTARDHLGHSDVSVTRRYLDTRQLRTVAAADIINRPRIASEERRD